MPATYGDSFQQYLNEIGRIPLLTDAEELYLGRTVQEWQSHPNPDKKLERRGRRARDRMMQANLRLVVHICKRFARQADRAGLDMGDLIQEGTIGLLRGVEKFDPSRGYKFSTYAYWWIRQAVQRGLEHSGVVRVPNNYKSVCAKAMAIRDKNPGITFSELAEELNERPEYLATALDRTLSFSNMKSLHETGHSVDNGAQLHETIIDPNYWMQEEGETRDQEYAALHDAIGQLEGDVSYIASGMVQGWRATEIGEALEISKTSASKRQQSVVRELRAILEPPADQLAAKRQALKDNYRELCEAA